MTHLGYTSAIEDMGQDGQMAVPRRRRDGETPAQPKPADARA
ncbi:MAG TPA: hypothetical protein VGG86_00775 [Roseiarcus sp.]|jgi:hypothetical protein